MSLGPRSRVEHASAPWAQRLQGISVPIRAVAIAALIVVGILLPRPWGGIPFLLIAGFLGWLLFLTWERLALPERLLRIAVLALAVAVAVVRIVPSA
ncbi:MAG: DUF6703 family protein [Dermatophilaceae bacterium]